VRGYLLLHEQLGEGLVPVTAPLRLAGSNGPCSLLYRHSGPGIGLCLAKQVLERQPKKKVNLAISNDLIEHPERPPDSHSCSSRKWQRIRCRLDEPELLKSEGKRVTKFVTRRRGLVFGAATGRWPAERTQRQWNPARHRGLTTRATEQSSGETRPGRRPRRQAAPPAGSSGKSSVAVKAAWPARKKTPAR
jgi:hypothetical protein